MRGAGRPLRAERGPEDSQSVTNQTEAATQSPTTGVHGGWLGQSASQICPSLIVRNSVISIRLVLDGPVAHRHWGARSNLT